MRYFQKLLCLLILVLAASFGVGGCVLLYSDFSVQRSQTRRGFFTVCHLSALSLAAVFYKFTYFFLSKFPPFRHFCSVGYVLSTL